MKTKLWLIFISFSLIFSACEKDTELKLGGRDISHLGDDYIFTVDENDTTSTALIAGQNQEVGRVEVELGENAITVTYKTYPGWFLTETHLHIAMDEKELFAQITNRAGNPRIGNFDYGEDNIFKTEVSYIIPKDDIKPESLNGCYAIAAHAVVAGLDAEGGSLVSLDAFAASLPETATIQVKWPVPAEEPNAYFPNVAITDGNDLLNGNYLGWCIQADAVIYQDPYKNTEIHSSYEEVPGYDEEFLIKLNWVINQNFLEKEGYTYGDIQVAIWLLRHEINIYDEFNDWEVVLGGYSGNVLNPTYIGEFTRENVIAIFEGAVANWKGFVPGCGDVIAIVLITPGTTVQDIIIEYPFPCYQDETAWGQGGLFDGNSWAMFFGVCPYNP